MAYEWKVKSVSDEMHDIALSACEHKVNRAKESSEYQILLKRIREAAMDGKFLLRVATLSEPIVSALRSEGFHTLEYNNATHEIRWSAITSQKE
jgi:hypothetical protein